MAQTNTLSPEFISSLSPLRQGYYQKLYRHTWFKNTSIEIQTEIFNLPEDHNGFIESLTERPDEIGEVDVLKLQKISRGNFLLIPIFEIRSNINNQISTYEYVSWKTGKYPGMRGIIFLETAGEISHFLVLHAHKFSTTENSFDSIGGLFLRINDNVPVNFPKKMSQEICYHLGLKDLKFNKVIDLGEMSPDYGLTNNISNLYAATIDVTNLPNVTKKEDFRLTHKPLGFEVEIIHINEFKDYVSKVKDSYFLGAVARLMVSKEISLNLG